VCSYRWLVSLSFAVCLLGVGGVNPAAVSPPVSPAVSDSEKTIWNLERSYWKYVEHNDLTSYRTLWDKNFLGWPSVSDAPVGKDHITDWITAQTSNGLSAKVAEVKPAAIQVTGDIAVVYYWVTFQWLDKDGKGEAHTLRVTHTWVRNGQDWRIVGGMSMPETMPQQKKMQQK
jgi:ketosteroid isomerase-like protein